MNEQFLYALLLYSAQAVSAFVIAFILWRFSKAYKKVYLRKWAYSWLCFCIYLSGASIAYLNPGGFPAGHVLKIAPSVIAIFFGYLQLLWLLEGTANVVYGTRLSRNQQLIIIIISFIASLTLTLLYSNDPEATVNRLMLRVGIRALFAGLCFAVAALIIHRKKELSGIGVTFVCVSFLIYGLEQIHYFVAILLAFYGNFILFTYSVYLGIFDLLIQALMGLGKIVWLLEDERKELKKANQELDSLVYSTSHNLRAPLTSILGLLNILKIEPKNQQNPEYIQLMENRVHKLDKTISDIMLVARNNKLRIHKGPVDINALVQEVIEDHKPDLKSNTINFVYEPVDVPVISTDSDRVKAILDNLINNAIKYHNISQPDPYIKIVVDHSSRKVILKVEDNGEGVAPDQKDKIFQMFYRANENSKGSGLGLYIVKEAAESLGGRVHLETNSGQGSTFVVELPDN